MKPFCLVTLLLAFALPAFASPPVYGYKVVATYPHSTSSYTEGFLYLNGLFYEGTGMTGHSALLAENPATGKIVQENDLAPNLFGEGIVDVGPNLLQWTWQTHVGFIVDRFSFRVIGQFKYTGEGWGMTRECECADYERWHGDAAFSGIRRRFAETRHIVVHDGAAKIDLLNELEWVKGEIYANVWHTDRIARISPKDGRRYLAGLI